VAKSQYDLLEEVLRRLDRAGILQGMVLVGSWCMALYRGYFGSTYHPSIKTRDVDLLIPVPPRFPRRADVGELLKDLGFVADFKGRKGYIRFQHPDLIVEFLVPERGRGREEPFDIPALGINAQPLRYLDLVLANTISLNMHGISVRVPHPAAFAVHKLIVSTRRQSDKAEQDRSQALRILALLVARGETSTVRGLLADLPAKWTTTVRRVLADHADPSLLAALD
jgi:hypothetical protein